jgi:hypothetical protein
VWSPRDASGQWDFAAPAWQPSHSYFDGDVVRSNGAYYFALNYPTPGLSASAGGPSGPFNQMDGTVDWDYIGGPASPAPARQLTGFGTSSCSLSELVDNSANDELYVFSSGSSSGWGIAIFPRGASGAAFGPSGPTGPSGVFGPGSQVLRYLSDGSNRLGGVAVDTADDLIFVSIDGANEVWVYGRTQNGGGPLRIMRGTLASPAHISF